MGLSSKTQIIANQPPMTSSITCSVSYISIISGVWAAKLSDSVWYFHPVSNIWVYESSGAIIPFCMEKRHEKATCLKHFETTSSGTSVAMFSMFSCHVRWWAPYLIWTHHQHTAQSGILGEPVSAGDLPISWLVISGDSWLNQLWWNHPPMLSPTFLFITQSTWLHLLSCLSFCWISYWPLGHHSGMNTIPFSAQSSPQAMGLYINYWAPNKTENQTVWMVS